MESQILTSPQLVLLDNNIFLEKKPIVSQNSLTLHEFITKILTPNLISDELIYCRDLINKEIDQRANILCEFIPDEIWVLVFELFANAKDISQVSLLSQVNKKWFHLLCTSLSEATILRQGSSIGLLRFSSIRSLTVKNRSFFDESNFEHTFPKLQKLTLGPGYNSFNVFWTVSGKKWNLMTNLSSLDIHINSLDEALYTSELFKNLRTLTLRHFCVSNFGMEDLKPLSRLTEFNNFYEFSQTSLDYFERAYGENYKVLEYFKELKVAKLYLYGSFIDCEKIQKTYPHIEFHWSSRHSTSVGYNYYRGEFTNSLFHGKGVLQYSNNDIYEGDFKNNKREGKGVMRTSNYQYERDFHNMKKRIGMKLTSGYTYEGEFKNDNIEGMGILTFPNGLRFEGIVENNNRVDKGIFYYPDGGKYEGDIGPFFIREGKGIMLYSDGFEYEGEWKNDIREGFGTFFNKEGYAYQGEWKNNKKEGKGFVLCQLTYYDGYFHDDKIEGSGIMAYGDGGTYDGEWKNNKKEGYGIVTYSNGEKYEGQWMNDEELLLL